jgi:hypothetical protein
VMPFDAIPDADIHVLLDATDMLTIMRDRMSKEPHKWGQGGYYDKDGTSCAIGWMDVVLCEQLDAGAADLKALNRLSVAMQRRIYAALPASQKRRNITRSIEHYNDHHSQRAVLKVLDKAIAASE